MNADNISNNFQYHPVKDKNQSQKYMDLRRMGKEMALLINSLCPESREKSLALTKVEESVMWANAAIARNE